MRRLGRVVLAVLAAFVVLPAGAASAHTVGGGGGTDYRTTLARVAPATPRVTFRVVEAGNRVEVTLHGPGQLIVLGYENEPYLRIDGGGVAENSRSSATYLNRGRNGGALPAGFRSDPGAAPVWHQVSAGRTARWHDHRVHFMGSIDPPIVRAAPGQRHRIDEWTIAFRLAGRPVRATGTLDWVPGPSPLPWWGLAAALGLGTVGLALRRPRALGAALPLLVACDVAHSVLAALARADGRLGGFLAGNVVQLVAWVIALAAARPTARGSLAGLYLAGSVGVALAAASGLTDMAVLGSSTVPAAGPAWLVRLVTAATIGIGFGLLPAVALAVRRRPVPPRADGPVGADRVPVGNPG